MSPTVSIGMPVYNSEKMIRRALDSLLAQDFVDFELIVSDNCSTDSTPAICAEYAARDARVRYHRNNRNYGQLRNFDIAASFATGKYFMGAADDDYWAPTFISRLVRELEEWTEAGLVMCAIHRIRPDGDEVDVIRFAGENDPWTLGRRGTAKALAAGYANKLYFHLYLYAMYRTDLMLRATPYSALSVPHPDRVFMCQFALATRWRFVDEVLYVRTVHYQAAPERLPEEEINRMIVGDRWGYSKTTISSIPFIIRSRLVPLKYKLAVLPVAAAMAWGYRGVLYRETLPGPINSVLGLGRKTVRKIR